MKENQLIKNGQTMTSLQIAEVTGKQHGHVMQAIRKMEPAWAKVCESIFGVCESIFGVCGSKFGLTSQRVDMPNGGYREVPCYSLTKTECLYIATKFNDEARARLILRWEELETAQPDMRIMQEQLEQAEATISELRQTISDRLEDIDTQSSALSLIINERRNDNGIHGKLDFLIGCLAQMLKFYRPEPYITPATQVAKRAILSDLKSIEKGGAR